MNHVRSSRLYRLSVIVVIVFGLGLSACGSDQRETNTSEGEITAKAQAWQERRILDYTVVYRESCFCPGGDVTVVVRRGQIDSASRAPRDGGSERVSNPLTVDGLFNLVQRAQREADELTVRFDDDLDFPDVVSIDWLRGAVDDEYNVTVLRLTQQ